MTSTQALISLAPNRIEDFDVCVLEGLDAVRAHASALRRSEAGCDFFSTWPWFENLAKHGVETQAQQLWILVKHRAGANTICLPLLKRARGANALFGPVTGGLSSYYSSLYGPIGDDKQLTPPALRAALAGLRKHSGRAGVIDLQPLDTDSRFLACMNDALRAEGYRTDTYFCFGNWHLQVAGRTYAAYEPGVPSRLRNTIKRGRKKLDASGPWTLRVHSTPGAALDAAIADFEAIYAQSWKVPEPFPTFVPGLCRLAADNGWLRLGVIRFEDKPIAAQLWIVKDRKALIYKLAYDEAYKRFSAGSVLSAEMMRRAIDDDGVSDVDYLTGDDSYKADWMSHRRERVGLIAHHPMTLQGLVGLFAQRLGRMVRRLRAHPAPMPPRTEEP